MTSISRGTWLVLAASLVVALALVALIPYTGVTGGHAEHGMADMDHTALMQDAGYDYVVRGDGVEIRMAMLDASKPATLATIRTHLQGEMARYQQGDFSDSMSPSAAAVAQQLTPHVATLTFAYHDTPVGGAVVVTSTQPDVVALLTQWAQAMEKDHGSMHQMP